MKSLKERFKNSYFVVNKIYLIFIFILLALEDFSLGFYYFLFSIIIYTLNTLTSKVPIEVKDNFEEKTFIYKETEEKELKLDLWLPHNQNNSNPLVFFCHGGGWISGFRNQPNNVSWCKYLASKGLAVVSIDYRYGYTNTMEDILSDYTDALQFVKDHAGEMKLDPDRIVLMGLSAGAHLSMLYASYYSSIENKERMSGIKSVVSYYGPSNLADILMEDNKSLFAKFALRKTIDSEDDEVEAMYRKEDIYNYYSPINWVSESMVPMFLVHGMEDKTVPYRSSVKMAKKLREKNIPYKFISHKEADHSFDTKLKDRKTIEILKQTVDFIKNSINS